jgi:hypothetical protein
VSGSFEVADSCEKGEQFVISVTDMEGDEVCSGIAQLVAVSFKDKLDKEGEIVATVRVHTLNLVLQHDLPGQSEES